MKEAPPSRASLTLSLGALGVVYGDIGTSPLYAFAESVHHGVDRDSVLGALSLIVWTLFASVTVKYLVLVLRADNQGEGGILALMALTGSGGQRHAALALTGIVGAALLYGDGIITPAITVIGAIEGLKEAWPAAGRHVVPLSVAVLIALFSVQRHGTGRVGFVFGPIMLVWFAVLAALGLNSMVRHPEVLVALNPWYGLRFLLTGGWTSFATLGSVFLVVTGAEALYADLGHFGARPIRLAWSALVFPALALNYFGQGALVLHDPSAAAHPFVRLAPVAWQVPLIFLSTAAGIVASQALISGAFSLTMQAMQLGYLPRLNIEHTSAEQRGQIYLPFVNFALAAGCILLVLEFKSSTALAGAYGIAVSLTMIATTFLLAHVAHHRWHWSRLRIGLLLGGFALVDTAFVLANLLKIDDGGWLPLLLAAVIVTVMFTWRRGRELAGRRLRARLLPLPEFIDQLARSRSLRRVSGTAIFLTANPDVTPLALVHNLKHNLVVHERVIVLWFGTAPLPHVPEAERISILPLPAGFWRIDARFGFMEDPEIESVREACRRQGFEWSDLDSTYFLGRESIVRARHPVLPAWRRILFAALSRNAQEPAAFFHLPPNRVVEIGVQVEL